MGRRGVLALAAWLATLVSCAAATLVVAGSPVLADGAVLDVVGSSLLYPLPFATVGLVIAVRRPSHPIGWLYLGAAFGWTLLASWGVWVDGLVRAGGVLPAGAVVAGLLANVLWAPTIAAAVALPALLLPDGRLPSPRWRWAGAAALVGSGLIVIAGDLYDGGSTQLPFGSPLALGGAARSVAVAVTLVGDVLLFGAIFASVAAVLLRFRRSLGVERQQMRWAAFGAAATAVLYLVALPAPSWAEDVVIPIVVLLPPLATAVAVLRYRLWDLDRIVSRTVSYLVLTGVLLLPYVIVVPLVSRVAGDRGNLAVALATLVSVAAFRPLRRRIQDVVDRRFDRTRYDGARTIEAFAAGLRHHVDTTSVAGDLVDAVSRALQPVGTAVWVPGRIKAGRGGT